MYKKFNKNLNFIKKFKKIPPKLLFLGYCCSFNVIKPFKAMTADSRNQSSRKTHFFGPNMGLSVVLKPLIENNAMTSINSEGVKILIDENDLFPSVSD